jgi:hypothetical protein
LGLAFGALASPWYYDNYYGPYDYAPDYAYEPAPPPAAGPPVACGSWSWNPGRGQYDWLPC